MQVGHYLKPLKSRKTPHTIFFLDTETHIIPEGDKGLIFPFKLGAMIEVRLDELGETIYKHTHRLFSTQDFFEILCNTNIGSGTIYVFAHNVGFDIRVLNAPEEFHQRGFHSSPPIINNRIFVWGVSKKRKRILFLDTANLGVLSVAQLGADMGFPKGEVDFSSVSDRDLMEYCIRDCQVLEVFVLKYIQFLIDEGLGAFRNTLASQALTAFRSRFMPKAPFIHQNTNAYILERAGYYGGRTEAFHQGKLSNGPYYYLDVNSMYPFVMREYLYPTRLIRYEERIPINWLRIRLQRGYCIARVRINTNIPFYPLRRENHLVFPTGLFETTLHSIELQEALERGELEEVYQCATYEPSVLFSDYIQFFYELKQQYGYEKNASMRYISKLFLNTLYGKFGQELVSRDKIGTDDPDRIWRVPIVNAVTGEHYEEVSWFGSVYREKRGGETLHSSPAIAGAVTAYARHHLFRLIMVAGRDNVYYCDTDSIITNKIGYGALSTHINSDALGFLKIEDIADEVTIFGLKDYIFGDKHRTKGVPQKAEITDEGKWRYMQFQGFKAWLRDERKGEPRAKEVHKRRTGVYHKGKVSPDGRIAPFSLSDAVQPVSNLEGEGED